MSRSHHRQILQSAELRLVASLAQFEEKEKNNDDGGDDEGRHQGGQQGVYCRGVGHHLGWNTNTQEVRLISLETHGSSNKQPSLKNVSQLSHFHPVFPRNLKNVARITACTNVTSRTQSLSSLADAGLQVS